MFYDEPVHFKICAHLLHSDLIDGFHEAVGFGEGDDDFLVVENVVEAEGASIAVFEPFLGGLIAADIKLPSDERNVFEILRVVDPDAPGGFTVRLVAD